MTRFLLAPKKSLLLLLLFTVAACFSGCDSSHTIVNGLDEREANEIIVLLESKNIHVQKIPSKSGQGAGGGSKIQLWDIAVDPDRVTEAMAILNANGLPRRPSQNLLDLFGSGGLVPSETQEKIRYEAGLAEQIASTLRKFDGVLDASVQLSFPQEDPLNPQAQKGKPTASVYIRHNGVLDDPNSHLVSKIKNLVASSVQGLSYDNVTVIGDRARSTDISAQLSKGRAQEKLEYVKVWSLVIAKDSLNRFQVLFFSFCIVILLLALLFSWLTWKFYPLLKNRGGFKALLRLTPLPDQMTKSEEKPKSDEPPKTDTKPKDEPQGPKVQENIENP